MGRRGATGSRHILGIEALGSPNLPHGERLELFSKTSRTFAASASAENGLLMNGSFF